MALLTDPRINTTNVVKCWHCFPQDDDGGWLVVPAGDVPRLSDGVAVMTGSLHRSWIAPLPARRVRSLEDLLSCLSEGTFEPVRGKKPPGRSPGDGRGGGI